MFILYGLLVLLFSIYTYSQIDLNLTLFNHPAWNTFRSQIIQLGYYHRDISSILYIIFVILLFVFYVYFYKKYKRFNPITCALITGFVILISYPFLSHDFFNYMFDAKILTFYGKNPYLFKALDFPQDHWIRFMHWTHRTYPYGPTFLPMTLLPSFLGMGKFILNMLFFKMMYVGIYIVTVYLLAKKDKSWAILFATNPLIIVEGLMNAHNDFIALSLGIIGYLLLLDKRDNWGRLVLLISGGIKYITLPLVFLSRTNKKINLAIFLLIIFLLIYLTFTSEVQSWYFLSLLVFIPLYPEFIFKLNIFFAGLLFAYYPFLRIGEWNNQAVSNKHLIMGLFLVANLIYLVTQHGSNTLFKKK